MKNLLRKAEKDHYDDQLRRNRHNLKKSWALIKEILNCKPLTVASNKFVVEGNLTSNKAEIAQAFNEQYKNAGPRLAEALPSPTRHYLSFMRAPNRDSLFLQNVLFLC